MTTDTPPPRFDAEGDATRRTWLASERTWLAWVRTGLTSTGLALAIGKVVPAVGASNTADWPYELLGAGYALFGVLLVGYGYVRRRDVEDAIAHGAYRGTDPTVIAVFTAISTLLALATIAVLVAA